MTLSPTFTSFTSGPISTTSPPISWPIVTGSLVPERSSDDSLPPPISKPPAWMCRSEWHMPQCVMRTVTSCPEGAASSSAIGSKEPPHLGKAQRCAQR